MVSDFGEQAINSSKCQQIWNRDICYTAWGETKMSSREGAQMKVSWSFHTMQCCNVGSWDHRGQQPVWQITIFCINSPNQDKAIIGLILLIALGIASSRCRCHMWCWPLGWAEEGLSKTVNTIPQHHTLTHNQQLYDHFHLSLSTSVQPQNWRQSWWLTFITHLEGNN